MAKLTKKQKSFSAVDREKFYGVDEAIALVKGNATAKFDETVEVALNLGVDPRHADQMGIACRRMSPAASRSAFPSRCARSRRRGHLGWSVSCGG